MLWKRSYKNRMTSSAIPASKTMNGVLRWPRYCRILWITARWHSTTSHLRLGLMQNPREPWKEQVAWQTGTTNRQPSTTLPPQHILPPLLHQLPFPLPGSQLKPLRKILRLYIKPRRIVILSGYPPIFPPNTATPRNPFDVNIRTWLRDILPRGDPSSEAERAEILQIRIHAQRLAVGSSGRLEPAFRVEGF